MDEVKLFKALTAAVAAYAALVGASLVWLAQQPLVVFRGAVEGRVSLLAYHIVAFERPVEVAGFDSLRLPGLIILAYGAVLAGASIFVLLASWNLVPVRVGAALETFVGTALGSFPALAVIRGAATLVALEVSYLARDYTFRTNAGIVRVGRATAQVTVWGRILFGWPMSAALAAVGVGAMLLLVFYWAVAAISVEESVITPEGEDNHGGEG